MAQFSEFIRRVKIQYESQGADKARADFESARQGQDNFNKATEHGERASRAYVQSQTRIEGSLISRIRATDKVARAEMDLQKTMSRIQTLMDKGGQVTAAHIKLLEREEAALRKVTDAENDNAKATENMIAVLTKFQKGQFTATLDAWTAKLREAKAAAEANTAATERMARSMTSLMSGFGGRVDVTGRMGAFSASDAERRAKEARAADGALRSSFVSGMSAFGSRDATAVRMGVAAVEDSTRKLTTAMTANASASAAMVQGLSAVGQRAAQSSAFIQKMSAGTTGKGKAGGLTMQERLVSQQTAGDVIASLATGASPMTILLQQGEQFLQPFGTGLEGVKNAASKLGPILLRFVLNPITMITAAVGTAAYAFDRWRDSQNGLTVAMNGLGRASGATLTQINAIAERVGSLSGISASAARGMAGTLLGSGATAGGLGAGLGLVNPLAKRLGMSQEDATRQIAGAFADPAKQAAELAKEFGVLTYAQQEQIRALAATGEKTQASAKLFDYLGQSLSKMSDTTGFFTRTWEAMTQRVSDTMDRLGKDIDTAVNGFKTFAQVAEDIKNAADAARQREADIAAGRLGELAGRYAPDASRLKTLQEQNAQAQKDLGNSRAMVQLGADGAAAADAVENLSNQLKNFKTQAEQVTEQTATNVAIIKEENILRKAQLQGAQLYRDEMRGTGMEALASARQMGVAAEALAQIGKAATDLERQAKNQLALAGKSPIEQQFLRLEQESDDQARQGNFSKKAFDDRVKAITKQYQFDTFGSPTQDVKAQSRMLSTQSANLGASTFSAAFDSAYMEKYNQLLKDNVEMTPAAVDLANQYALEQANLATQTEAAARKQNEFTTALNTVRITVKDIGSSLVDAFRRGESAIEAMRGTLDRLISRLVDKTLDSALDGVLGKMGSAQTGSAGGFLGTALGGIGKLFGFANGGVMTGAGMMPLHAYAGGGIASGPQMALFGEGRRPEAYVPLPDGRNIPVKMQAQGQGGNGKVTINNYAAGVDVETQRMSDGELLVIVNKMVDQKMKAQVPGIVANSQRRAM
jgi:hypothetical protein